jgi:hypothetical protein
VVTPSPTPNAVPIIANNAANVVRETACPKANNQRAGAAAPPYSTTSPTSLLAATEKLPVTVKFVTVRVPIETEVGPNVASAVPVAIYVHVPAALLYQPVVVSEARVSEGAANVPAANFSGPVKEDTPVVATLCVIAVAISLLIELASADLMVVPATYDARGKLYVPVALRGVALTPYCFLFHLLKYTMAFCKVSICSSAFPNIKLHL